MSLPSTGRYYPRLPTAEVMGKKFPSNFFPSEFGVSGGCSTTRRRQSVTAEEREKVLQAAEQEELRIARAANVDQQAIKVWSDVARYYNAPHWAANAR